MEKDSKEMNIDIIATGSTDRDRSARHWGISFLLGNILFDTFGLPETLLSNMQKMKIDPVRISHIVISHEHWDHTSGLWALLKLNRDIKVYVCPHFSGDIKKEIRTQGAEIVEVSRLLKIEDNIFSTGEIKGSYDNNVIYEQALVYKSNKGLVIISGCAHPGILTIAKNVIAQFKDPVYAVIGGFHLKDTPIPQIKGIIKDLKALGVIKVAPTHCTGSTATQLFKETFGDNFLNIAEGQTYSI